MKTISFFHLAYKALSSQNKVLQAFSTPQNVALEYKYTYTFHVYEVLFSNQIFYTTYPSTKFDLQYENFQHEEACHVL